MATDKVETKDRVMAAIALTIAFVGPIIAATYAAKEEQASGGVPFLQDHPPIHPLY